MNRSTFLCLLIFLMGCSTNENAPAPGVPNATTTNAQSLLQKLVGTWQDVGTETTEKYAADGTVDSHMNEPLSIPFSEAGLKGTATTQVTATAKGTWILNGNQLQVSITDVATFNVGAVTIEQEENLLGVEEVELAEVGRELQAELQRDLPQMITGQTATVTIVSVTEDKLVTKDEDGVIEEHVRVASE